MSPLALLDNPLFLQNWRERMRPAMVIASLIVTSFVVFLIFAGAYVERTFNVKAEPNLNIFLWLANAQGVALLLLGSMSAHAMAARERIAGTLDFHRSSPSPRFNQVLGLLFGSTSLEWTMVIATLPISLTLAIITPIGLMTALTFYIELFICAIFFHLFAIFIGVQPYGDPQGNTRRDSPFKILVLFYILGQLFIMPLSSQHGSFMYHMSCFPAYSDLNLIVHPPTPGAYRYPSEEKMELLSTFYGVKLPTLLFQIMVQFPLILFLWTAISRKISYPQRPVLSKIQSLGLVSLLIFLFLGSAWSVLLNPSKYFDNESYFLVYLYYVLFLGILGAIMQTPNRLTYFKGLKRAKKLNVEKLNPYDDQNSNVYFLIMLIIVIGLGALGFSFWIDLSSLKMMSYLLLTILQILILAGAWEFFSLGENYLKKSLFVVVLSIPWFFLPIFSLIVSPALKTNLSILKNLLCSLSPFFTLAVLTDIFKDSKGPFEAYLILSINLVAAIILLMMATRLRQSIRRSAA